MLLEIENGVGAGLCYQGFHPWASLLDDLLEDLRRKLLALIVADDADLYLLLIAEILVIVHLARDKGVGTGPQGVVEQEVACPATDSHLTNRSAQ